MPYELREANGRYCVYKVGDNEPLKCYAEQSEAAAYLGALEANVNDAKQVVKMMGGIPQMEAAYVTVSTEAGEACANCRFFRHDVMEHEHDAPHDCCQIVDNWPEPILPTGYCTRWEAKPDMMAEVEAVSDMEGEAMPEEMPEEMAEEMAYEMDEDEEKALTARIWERIKQSSVYRSIFPEPAPKSDAFQVFKGADGRTYWLATYTNDFEDLENEILSRKAHDGYILRLDMGLVPMPELWAWHTPGSKHGETLSIWRNEHFVRALGVFDETSEGERAAKEYEKNPPKLSHGFTAPDWAFKDGVFESYNTFEISTLPDGAEANPFTRWEDIETMPLQPAKRQFLESVLGKDKLAELEAQDETRGKALEAAQQRYKDFADTTVAAETPASDGQPAIAQLLTDLIEGQGQLADLLVAQERYVQAQAAELGKALKEVADLKTLVNSGTRRAEQSAETIVSGEAVAAVRAKLNDDTAELEKAWGVKMKPAVQR